MSRKWQRHGWRWWVASMTAGDVVMADTDKNPQRREMGPRRQRPGRRSTGAPTGADGAARQQDAGSTVGAACSAAQSEKTDMVPEYRRTGVLYWCAGGLRRAVVRNQAAMPDALPGIVSVGS